MPQGRGEGGEEFESLYLTLPSNGGGAQFDDTNRNNDYKIKLPYRLRLPGSGWQVALSSITVPRPAVPAKLDRTALLKRIPADSRLVRVVICLYNGSTALHRPTNWVTMGEVIQSDSVNDGATFMKRLKLLLERNIFDVFYWHSAGNEYALRRTKWVSGRDTGVRGYPLLNWNDDEEYMEVDWSGTDDDRQLELNITHEFAELIGCVSHVDGDAVNEWHYGPHVILYPKYNKAVNAAPYISSEKTADLKGPVHYSVTHYDWFGFRNHAQYRFILNRDWFFAKSRVREAGVAKDSMIYVYSNVGRGTILGGQITDLLRQVPVTHEDKEGFVYYEPKNMQHIDVRNTELDVVEVAIGKPEGGLAELGEGITTVTLHFRRVP